MARHKAGPDLEPDFPMPERYSGVYLERRRASGWQLYEAVGIARGDRESPARQMLKNFELFGAPHTAIITTDAEQGVYGAVDSGLYVGTFLLAAQSLGLGAVPQAALATYAPLVREHFSIPKDRLVLLGISFGYPDLSHPPTAIARAAPRPRKSCNRRTLDPRRRVSTSRKPPELR